MVAEKMHAIVVRAPMQFNMEEVPIPDAPPGGLLLKVEAVGLCGSDLRTLRSGHPRVTFPWTIGHEICGRVAAVGPRYQGAWEVNELLAVGPLAYCGHCDFCMDGRFELCEGSRELGQAWPGGMAEYIGIPEECVRLGNLRAVPEDTDPALAAISEPVSSCINAQEKGEVSLGDNVVIFGAGPIGCIHISLARARGADKIIMVDILDERLKMAEAFNPDATLNASKTDLSSEVRRLLSGKGPDVVITASPSPATLVQAVEMARKGGRILMFGGLPADQSKPGIDMNVVHYHALHLIGTTTFAPRHQLLALKLILSGRIPANRLITRFPLEDFAAGALQALDGKLLKAVFIL